MALVLSFTGIDSIYAQTVHANHFYRAPDIKFGKKFVDMISQDKDETMLIDFRKFHEIE